MTFSFSETKKWTIIVTIAIKIEIIYKKYFVVTKGESLGVENINLLQKSTLLI